MRFWIEFSLALATNALVWGFGVIGHDLNPVWGYIISLASICVIAILWVIQRPNMNASELEVVGPDWSIRDLFFHIDPNVLEDDNPKNRSPWEKIEAQLKDRLSVGQLKAWGRLADQGSRQPLTPIPETYWKNAALTFWFFNHEGNIEQVQVVGKASGDYADVQFNKHQALMFWPNHKTQDNSIWLAFALLILLLTCLAVAMAYPQWKDLLRNAPKSVPPAGIKVGMADIQKGPQIKDGELSIRIPVTNMSGSPLIITVKSTSFVFEGMKFSYPEKVLQYPLAKDEVIYLSYPNISNLPKAVAAYNFELGIDVDYGLVDGPMERTVSRKLNCTVPVDSLDKGICIVVSTSDMEFNYAAQK